MATKDDVPKVQALIAPTLLAIREIGGSGTLQEITDKVAELIGLPEDVQSVAQSSSNDTWFAYRCRWARTYLKWAELVDNSERGVWSLTEKGRTVDEQELSHVYNDVQELMRQRKSGEKQPDTDEASDDETASEELEDRVLAWKEHLLETLKKMPPDGFERLCQRILRESGFSKVEVSGRSGDGGIDGSGVLRINLISFQTLFQCKRWKDAVGSSVVRDFRGAMIGRADKGLIMTTGRFTADAQKEAVRDGAPAIELIDGDELCLIIKNLRLGVSIETVEAITVDERFFAQI